jgi:hypothetical protein
LRNNSLLVRILNFTLQSRPINITRLFTYRAKVFAGLIADNNQFITISFKLTAANGTVENINDFFCLIYDLHILNLLLDLKAKRSVCIGDNMYPDSMEYYTVL